MSERQDTSIHQGLHLYDGTDFDTVVERVAHGGFGVIAFGPNRYSNRNEMVAYKTLRRELLADPRARATFVRECLLWIGMWPHANITSANAVLEMGDAEGQRPFIALEYAEHGSLRELLRAAQRQPNGRLPLERGLDLAQQIAAGLVYLHTADPAYLRNEPTVHRDLKPENVLITGDARAVITDFGLAKIIEEATPETLVTLAALLAGEAARTGVFDTQTATQTTSLTGDGTTMGTVAYMPPEQWRDARAAQPSADIYAFGVMLSELLAGRHALLDLEQRHTADEWRAAHARPSPRLLRSVEEAVPLEVETLYLRCLARDPASRPTAAEALAMLRAGARAAGFAPYQPREILAHTPYNECIRWHKWSIAYVNFGRYEEALDRSDRALSLARPLHAERPGLVSMVLLTRGNIFMSWGKELIASGDQRTAARYDAEAEAAYQESLATRQPETTAEGRAGRAMVWNQLGIFHTQRGRWAEADAAYARALDLKPDKSETYFNRALTLGQRAQEDLRQGRGDNAVAHLRQARVFAITSASLGDPTARAVLRTIEEALRELGES